MIKINSLPPHALRRWERTFPSISHVAAFSQRREVTGTEIINRRDVTCPGTTGAEDGGGLPGLLRDMQPSLRKAIWGRQEMGQEDSPSLGPRVDTVAAWTLGGSVGEHVAGGPPQS